MLCLSWQSMIIWSHNTTWHSNSMRSNIVSWVTVNCKILVHSVVCEEIQILVNWNALIISTSVSLCELISKSCDLSVIHFVAYLDRINASWIVKYLTRINGNHELNCWLNTWVVLEMHFQLDLELADVRSWICWECDLSIVWINLYVRRCSHNCVDSRTAESNSWFIPSSFALEIFYFFESLRSSISKNNSGHICKIQIIEYAHCTGIDRKDQIKHERVRRLDFSEHANLNWI